MLLVALKNERLPHAYVFHGPTGVGKFTSAVAFARLLLCHDRQTDLMGNVMACDGCESCQLIPSVGATDALEAAHPDLHVVTKELARYSDDANIRQRKLTTIPVKVLRSALLEPVYRAAQLQHNKVFIVDEAELLNPTGQNLLLKTLEEPPPGTFLILITSSEDRLLPTIRSRSHRVAFTELPDQVIADWVAENSQENTNIQRWLVEFAAGSLGRASIAVTYGLHHWARTVLSALDGMTNGEYPAELGIQMKELIDDYAERWVKDHTNASKDAANKQAASLMWLLISQRARTRIAELAPGTDDPSIADQTLGPWLNVIDALTDAERDLFANVNMGLVCDHVVSKIFRALKPHSQHASR